MTSPRPPGSEGRSAGADGRPADPGGEVPPQGGDPPIPGPASRRLARRLARVESRNVTFLSEELPVFWESAEGCEVRDADGNRFADLTAAFGVAAVGHRHPAVVEAVRSEAGRLLHGMGDVHPPGIKVRLLERLAALAPWEDSRAVLGLSGSDAVETALKTARLYTGRPGVLCFHGAYHGLGYGALSVTDRRLFREPFEDQLNPHVLRAPYPHPFRPPTELAGSGKSLSAGLLAARALERVSELLASPEGGRVGAVIVEPIQGRGGDVVPPEGFLAGLRELCDRTDRLLVLDEIYTGLGRTGSRLECLASGVRPDLLCVGKALGGGMPLSACLGPAGIMEAWPPSAGEAKHTSTFLGHPVACAAALATLDVIESEGLVRRAREEGGRWCRELREMSSGHPSVGEVRGRGLMIGIDLIAPGPGRRPAGELAARVVAGALRRGWILLAGAPEGNVLSLSPPLTAPRELLDAAVVLLDEVLSGLE